MTQGKFIVVEGLEGAGKSTAIATIGQFLSSKKIAFVTTREPGGTPLAEQLRTLVKATHADEALTDEAELLLMYAARVQLVNNVIKPALSEGKWVIGDRHDLSSQAYQGGGRGLDSHLMHTIRDAVLGAFKPDLTLYMDVPADIGLARVVQRGAKDRIEEEHLSFFERVRIAYQQAAKEDQSIQTIDASNTLEIVTTSIQQTLERWYTNHA